MRTALAGILLAIAPHVAMAAADPGGSGPARPSPLQSQKLVGDVREPGMYVVRQHLPAGGLVRPHFHSADRQIAVLSGVLYVCNSAAVSADAVTAHKAGDVFPEPAKSVHCSWAKDGDVDYLEIGMGPVTTTSVEK